MKRLNGFSLMEMMIVLAIVAIVAAASAPMVNRKMVRAASEKSPWVFVNGHGGGESIAYNIGDNADRKTASIGAVMPPAGVTAPRLYINTNNGTTNPHILFGHNNGHLMHMIAGGEYDNLWINNTPPVDNSSGCVVLGSGQVTGDHAVAIGDGTTVSNSGAIAIGAQPTASGENSIAIGFQSSASADNAIALGNASATSDNAIALGNASATSDNAIALGNGTSADDSGVALGNGTSAGDSGVALGNGTSAGGNGVALGNGTTAQIGSIALGNGTTAQIGSIAIGTGATGNNARGIAIGEKSQAIDDSIAIGMETVAGPRAVVLGAGAIAYGNGVCLGYKAETKNMAMSSIAIGNGATVNKGDNAIAIGNGTSTSGDNAIAIGNGATVDNGANAVAIGQGAKVTGDNNIVIRTGTETIGTDGNPVYNKEIVLGDRSTIVKIPGKLEFDGDLRIENLYIPGNLMVDGHAVLARNGSSVFIARVENGPPKENSEKGNSYPSAFFMGDDKGGDDNTRCIDNGNINSKYKTIYYSVISQMTSDRRLKNVGEAFKGGLAELKKLELYHYTFKDDKDKTPHVGVMAQDLQKIFPDAVVKGEDGFLRIRMEDMFYAVINAVKELDSRLSVLEQKQKKIDELEQRVDTLEKRLADLEKKVK